MFSVFTYEQVEYESLHFLYNLQTFRSLNLKLKFRKKSIKMF